MARRRKRALDLAALQAETAHLQVDILRAELTELHRELARRDVELVSALHRLATVTDRLRVETEHDRADQRRLTRSVELLAMFSAGPPLRLPSTNPVIGGSVDPARAAAEPAAAASVESTAAARPRPDDPDDGEPLPPAATDHGTIDLTAELAADLPLAPVTRAEAPLECSVHLQFGDRWIEGFQIEETIHAGDGVQFRLRRRVDGWVLPELFDESEVRVFTRPVVDPAATRS
ncbi:MAG: hypothetical protein ACXV8T_08840 [Acidimicrobiia bacterium]